MKTSVSRCGIAALLLSTVSGLAITKATADTPEFVVPDSWAAATDTRCRQDGIETSVEPLRMVKSSATNGTLNQLEQRDNGYICYDKNKDVAPLLNDCADVMNHVNNLHQTFVVQSGECRRITQNTCTAYICAYCNPISADTDGWAGDLIVVYNNCLVPITESGIVVHSDIFGAGLEYSGQELPEYEFPPGYDDC